MPMVNNSERKAVILTALPCEYRAVRAHLEDLKEISHPQGTIYEQGVFKYGEGACWTIAIAEIGAGNNSASMETERAASFFSPKVMLFIGIAGGIKDVSFFDVVTATKVYGYESGKAKEKFEPRPEVGQSSYSLIQRSRAEAKKSGWVQRLKWQKPPSHPRVHIGPIAAGEKVVASTRSQTHRFIRSAYGDALAVEMEGAGFLQAAHANSDMQTLIIRGISDLIDKKEEADTSGYQDIAAHMASAFAFEVLANLDLRSDEERGLFTMVLSGSIKEKDRARVEAILVHLREISGDAHLTLVRMEDGSVKLLLEGSRDGYKKLMTLFQSGRLSVELGEEVISLGWNPTDVEMPPTQRVAEQLGVRMTVGRKWYIVHTYSGFEERVKETLRQRAEALGMGDAFGDIRIPTETVVEYKGGKKKETQRKFFPGYVLVEMEMSDASWHVVKNTPKVTGFVGTGKNPTPLSEEEVNQILEQVVTAKEKPKPKYVFEKAEPVRITDGPFNNFTGVIDEVNVDRNTLKVMVTIFGRQTPVELDFSQVRKLFG